MTFSVLFNSLQTVNIVQCRSCVDLCGTWGSRQSRTHSCRSLSLPSQSNCFGGNMNWEEMTISQILTCMWWPQAQWSHWWCDVLSAPHTIKICGIIRMLNLIWHEPVNVKIGWHPNNILLRCVPGSQGRPSLLSADLPQKDVNGHISQLSWFGNHRTDLK